MFFQQLFAKKSLETLAAEAKGENRLRRILGPVGLTSLGIGAIIGAGIFVMTGRAAAQDAGPAIMLSYVVAGFGCLFAALCYAEFASTTPVAGSAYTYAYATLGEVFAWFIGWDLVLEYAMACAVVAAGWAQYLNAFLKVFIGWEIPKYLCSDPFTTPGAIMNLPAVLIILACTAILVVGIRESATTNAILVMVKIGVVLFVIGLGWSYVNQTYWTDIPVEKRITPEGRFAPDLAREYLEKEKKITGEAVTEPAQKLAGQALALFLVNQEKARTGKKELTAEEVKTLLTGVAMKGGGKVELPTTEEEKKDAEAIVKKLEHKVDDNRTEKWGLLALMGIDRSLSTIDNNTRSNFMPYGISGIMLGAAIVFFAYIGFDAISTHSEEAKNPSRDMPIGILASLAICTVLYIGVAAVITGMVPYPDINPKAAVSEAFIDRAKTDNNPLLSYAGGLIATGALAGLTSVLLITFLSQARIFLAMARDGLLPPSIFAAIHPRFRTPHISTMLTGGIIAVVAAFTPIEDLELMVNIGTLAAFVVVCAAVLMLRIQRPDAHRPFRCPAVYIVAPLGILVNLMMMLFLPLLTWLRLLGWLAIGLLIYFGYGYFKSVVGRRLRGEKVEQIEIHHGLGEGH
jgi:APA family basic amino acid/polyamine antiporter